MVLTAGQWKSGHGYMNSAYRGAVEEWTRVHEEWYRKAVEEWTQMSSECYTKTTILEETSTDDIHLSTGHPN